MLHQRPVVGNSRVAFALEGRRDTGGYQQDTAGFEPVSRTELLVLMEEEPWRESGQDKVEQRLA